MRKILKSALPVFLAGIACLGVGTSGAFAVCPSPVLVSQGFLGGSLDPATCGTDPSMAFWLVGNGEPALLSGIDGGSTSGELAVFGPQQFYNTDWGNSGVDGCPLDATEGELVTSASDVALAEATLAAQRWKDTKAGAAAEEEALAHKTRDGVAVHVLGSCGSPGEAGLVQTFGMEGIGVYRTELQFLSSDGRPTEDQLTASYRAIIEGQRGKPVSFRLLDVAAATLQVDAEPLDVLPMRLNSDAMADLVVLRSSTGPAVAVTPSLPASIFTVTNTNDSGPGSLRRAINDANFYAGADEIRFNIPGVGPRSIHALSG